MTPQLELRKEFGDRVSRSNHILGDIPTLNSLLRQYPEIDSVEIEGLLFDLCPEYSDLPESERLQVLKHSVSVSSKLV